MTASARRAAVLAQLEAADTPVSASLLAKEFSVSRQIIVGDIALLRASGEEILSTPKGYMMQSNAHPAPGVIRTLACVHTPTETEAELSSIVYYGGEILDVSVSHPVYGEISAPLNIKSNHDIALFLEKVHQDEASLLSNLTDGLHLHRVLFPSNESYASVCKALQEKGILFVENEANME